MATTAHLGITLIEQAQAQKEVSVNEALLRMDALLNTGAKDKDLAAPPSSPAEGDVYIVAASATGDWTGQSGNLAYFNQIWRFIAPREGLTLWVNDEDKAYSYNGSVWVENTVSFQNIPMLGVNTAADGTNKLAVKSAAVLLDNVGAGVQVKVNKNASSDTASFLFQDNYSGRAEIGCVGDDDFQFKVSPDGSGFSTAIRIDKTDASATLKELRVDNIASGFTGSEWVVKQAGYQTGDATTTVIASIPLAEGEMLTVHAMTNGFRNDYTEGFGAARYGTYRRGTGGNVTIVGSTSVPHNDRKDFAESVTFGFSANTTTQTVDIRVTGAASKTINWVCSYQYMKTKTNG